MNKPIGPYSTARKIGNMIFVSGQIALTKLDGTVEEQTHQVMKNLKNIIEKEGCTLQDIVKTTIFLSDMDDFATVNEIYASYLTEPYPARATVEVSRLPKDVKVEIDAIAICHE